MFLSFLCMFFENRDLKKNEKLCFIKFIILVQIYFKGYLGTYKYYLDGQIIFASGDNLSTNLWNYPFLIWILLLIISETVIFPSTSQMFSVSKNLWEFSRPCLLRKRSYWGHHWADPLLEGWALAWVSPRTGRWDSCPPLPEPAALSLQVAISRIALVVRLSFEKHMQSTLKPQTVFLA